MSPARTLATMVGIGAALGLIYVFWLPGGFKGGVWPPSDWLFGDLYRAVALLPLTVCGVLLYGIARPLRGDPLQRAQGRNRRTLLIVLLLVIVVAWAFWEVAQPRYFT
jgi:hypothetical protein